MISNRIFLIPCQKRTPQKNTSRIPCFRYSIVWLLFNCRKNTAQTKQQLYFILWLCIFRCSNKFWFVVSNSALLFQISPHCFNFLKGWKSYFSNPARKSTAFRIKKIPPEYLAIGICLYSTCFNCYKIRHWQNSRCVLSYCVFVFLFLKINHPL